MKNKCKHMGNNELSHGRAQIPKRNICFKSFVIINISCSFYIGLQPIIRKFLKRPTYL